MREMKKQTMFYRTIGLCIIPYVPKKITIRLSASITSKVLNESK